MTRLKSLELQGYKTFASRNLFEFPANVTAIVGPNGSGKSNVADSLRWVLGEQSYSLLRGRKTEDMIFSGSEQRPRASMASATITFDNEDGWLPIDFSEVSITRRAFRDGQNEYLLNGQRVRLKEISELLGRSGLAERTYTIIGQGLVDAALSLKPDERRRFFEEAAGIGLYRSRREEAINRLDATRRNLERVHDILSELEPRLNSLEKQARRAMEYERIKADLRVLLRDWYGYHWHRVQQEVLHAQEVFKAQDERLELARQRQAEVESKVDAARTDLQALRAELNGWHGRSSGLHRQREQVSRSLAVLDERQRAMQEREKTLRSDLSRLEEERFARQERLEELCGERDRLNTELVEAQQQLEQARANLRKRQVEREKAEKQLRETRRMLVDTETRQVQTRAHHNELLNRVEELKKSRQSLVDLVEKEGQALAKATEQLERATSSRKEAEERLKAAEAARQDAIRQIESLDEQRKKAQDERSRIEAERSRVKAQLDVLEQAERSMSGLNQGARFLLNSVKQGKLKGNFRPLNALVEAPAEYETAIAAVLGEHLDGIFIEERDGLETVLTLLEQGEKGRAVLFPVELAQEGSRIQAPVDPDCLGVAAALVKTPDGMQHFIDQLLGQVIVVRNRAAARRLVSQLPRTGRAVTLRGEVFWGSGIVVAGQDGRESMIARPRQKRELQEALNAANERFSEATGKLSALEAAIAEARNAEKRAAEQVRTANQQSAQVIQAYQKAALELEQVRQRSEWQRKQLTSVEEQAARASEEVKQTDQRIAETAVKIEALTKQVREASHSLNSLPLDEFQSEVNHWNTTIAVSSRAARDAENRVEEHKQTIEANNRQHQAFLQRLEEVASSLKGTDEEKTTLRAQENELSVQIEALQKEIEPAEQKLGELERDYARLQGDQDAAHQAVSVAERYATQSQLELGRQRELLDSLKRRIEDDFGLVALEYTSQVSGQTPLPLGDMVEELPVIEQVPAELEENINRQRALLRRMGAINPDAQSEYESVSQRYEFLTTQVEDLRTADADLRKVISELDELMRKEFRKTFDAVAYEFKGMFTRLFGGGSARLILTDAENPVDAGIDIEARLPGRREQGLALLSGGERSLTAVALICSLLKVSPTPFCVMDEVDAMLDEANVGRFCELLSELSQRTQFILITHNRNTVQTAGVIYGVTMGRDSASQIISLRLDEISEDMVK